MTSMNHHWDYFDRPLKDHKDRPVLLVVALAGCGLAWALVIAAVLAIA